MIIKSNLKEYKVCLEENFGFIQEIMKLDNCYIVIDKNVYEIYKKDLFLEIPQEKISIIEATEENKTIETVLQLCEILTQLSAKRNIQLISFGGGIIQDITGFLSNVLYRGIKWIYVPTTLLAACDSCIGSKTSLNYKSFKNLLGTFYPPDQIYICPVFFQTLSKADFQSGLGEVVKFNLLRGKEGLNALEYDLENLLNRKEEFLNKYLLSSLEFKKAFIEADEFDKGVRIYLNFAHTFGHAFETVSHYTIPHGTAVAMGMIAANRVSLERGFLSKELVERSEKLLSKIIDVNFSNIDLKIEEIIHAMKKDKKQIGADITVLLLNDEMKIGIYNDVSIVEVAKGIESMYEVLGC